MTFDIPKGKAKSDIKALSDLSKHFLTWPTLPDQLDEGLYNFNYGHFNHDVVYSPSKENRLFVLLSGFADRKKLKPPVFQRWSWAHAFPGHCLYIADPTLKLNNELSLAWYMGTEEKDLFPSISEIIITFSKKLDIPLENVIIYGSSGGGFAALRLASILPQVMSVVINPQIDITRYKSSHVEKFLDSCFNEISREEAIEKYPNRFSIIPSCHRLVESRILYIQNKVDGHHLRNHFSLFAKEMNLDFQADSSRTRNIESFLFSHPDGHKKAEPRELFPKIMEKVINYLD